MIISLLAIFVFFNFAYIIGRVKKDYSILDVFWGPSFFVIFISSFLQSNSLDLRSILVGALVLIWAIRLGVYIFLRSVKIGKEDFRYASWRTDWGSRADLMFYFKVYMLQMILSISIGYPLYLINMSETLETSLGTPLDIIGISLWGIGFFFESVGDFQKNKFKNDPNNRGKIMDSGLWRYTRHPNYFGEALLWWGVFFILCSSLPWYQIIWGPLILNFLLLKVSGVTMLEEKYVGDDAYQSYRERTNAFIPWFPKGEL